MSGFDCSKEDGKSVEELGKKKKSEVAQSCLTLCSPMNCSLPGSSVHGVFQARTLEWVVMPSSRESSQPRGRTQVSCIAGRLFTIWATREVPPVLNGCGKEWMVLQRDVTVLRFSRNWNWRSQNGVLLILPGNDLAFHRISLHCSLLMLIPRAVERRGGNTVGWTGQPQYSHVHPGSRRGCIV